VPSSAGVFCLQACFGQGSAGHQTDAGGITWLQNQGAHSRQERPYMGSAKAATIDLSKRDWSTAISAVRSLLCPRPHEFQNT
jgi:hypothetical protein